MKDCNFYKNKGRIFCDWIKTSSAEDCVQATVPGMRGGREGHSGVGAQHPTLLPFLPRSNHDCLLPCIYGTSVNASKASVA